MDNIYYVYEFIRLDTNEPFYVGKGKTKRWKELKFGRNENFIKIVNSVPIAVSFLEKELNEETAYEYETFYIEEYREMGFQLANIVDGGKGCPHTKSLKLKQAEMHKGVIPSGESKLKNRMAHLGKNKGKENHKSRKIICLNNGEIFECISDAKIKYGKIDIQACCCGNKSYAGILKGEKLVWAYYENFLEMTPNEINNKIKTAERVRKGANNPKSRMIICTTTGKIFESAREAGTYYNLKTTSHITSCCQGKRNYCGKLSDGTKLTWAYYF